MIHKALTAKQSRDAEKYALDAGTSLAALMDAAGATVARELEKRAATGSVLVVCGPGNNGGDGWVAARLLHERGRRVQVASLREPAELSGIAGDAARAALDAGVPCVVGPPAELDVCGDRDTVIDALLGTGSALPLRGAVAEWSRWIAGCDAFVLAVDVPTGVDSDTGFADENAVRADCTVCMGTAKLGVVLFPGAAHAGEVVVADMGIPPAAWADVAAPEVWTRDEYAALVPVLSPDTHKNDRGRVLVVAGSQRYPGAAVLAARGAQRCGAGYVTLATPGPVVPIAQSHLLSAPVHALPDTNGSLSASAAQAVLELARDYDAVVLGPGLTVAEGAVEAVRAIVAAIEKPLVLDADGLNAFAGNARLLDGCAAPLVLTPHPGELTRLLGVATSEIQADRPGAAGRLASASRVVVLKGAGTVVRSEERCLINTSGTPALATAGTGDVLAGMVGALIAAGRTTFQAAALATHLHGLAGEIAAREMTEVGVIAEDVTQCIPTAIAEVMAEW